MPETHQFQNAVLRNLSQECIERLRLRPVTLEADRCVAGLDERMRWLLFIETGSVALSLPLRDGSAIETGIFGNKSVVSATALIGPRESLHQATVRCAGHGFICSIENGLEEFARAEGFHDLILADVHAQLMQVTQIAACNRRHDVQQRLCRWMLHCQGESASQHIQVTHENLAEALGVRRTTVTGAMHLLRIQGVISYSRGHIRLLDQSGLQTRACECYEALQKPRSANGTAQDEVFVSSAIYASHPGFLNNGFHQPGYATAK